MAVSSLFEVTFGTELEHIWCGQTKAYSRKDARYILSPRWKYFHRGGNILTAVEILSPRWKYFHRGGNSFSLDSLQRNLDFIVLHLIHVGSLS